MRKAVLSFFTRAQFFLTVNRSCFSMQRPQQHVSFKLNVEESLQQHQPAETPPTATPPSEPTTTVYQTEIPVVPRHVETPAATSHHSETSASSAPTATASDDSRHKSTKRSKRVSVAIVIVGDEILKGQVSDVNSHFLCQRLAAVGADVRRISVIPDDKDAIAQEIKHLHRKVRWIVTAGGIGPTHDDITFESVAEAFRLPMEKNEMIISLLQQHLHRPSGAPLTFAESKLASVPAGSTVMFGDIRTGDAPYPADNSSVYLKPGMFPVVRCENVIILPGIPILLQRAFNTARHLFESDDGALAVRNVYVKLDELAFADTLTAIAEVHKPRVVIGSYPELTNNYYQVRIMFESADLEALESAIDAFVLAMPKDSVIRDSDLPGDIIAEAEERTYKFSHTSQELRAKVSHALHVTETALNEFGPENIAICFTGGKDCTAVLHILYAALKHLHPETPTRLMAWQLSTFEPFAEVERFIYETKRRYGFHFVTYVGDNMKESLKKFIEQYPNIKAVFMGTRRNDPSASNLAPIQKTDPGWPELTRISPILDWSYSDVWSFIRHLHLPYCSLYDRGYTSLGNPSTTHPNRLLLSQSPRTSLLHYRPAYELEDDSTERAGRDTPQSPTQLHRKP